MDKLLNKAITISGKEEKLQGGNPVVKIKDEKNLTYTVYKTKQDGSESVAWQQLQELNLGDTVQIGFVEDFGEYEGKKVTYRTIRNFNKDIGEGMVNASQSKSSNTGHSGASQRESSEAFGLRLAIHGMINGLLAGGHSPQDVSVMLPELFGLEEDIEKRLSKPASLNVAEGKIAKANEGTIDPQELFEEEYTTSISVEDIPF